MQELAIKVENLTKIYKLYDKPIDRLKESLHITKKKYHREHYALKNINFEVNKGETIGIIGTNGSGKSTLLKIITGVLNSTSGQVIVGGRISALLELGAGFNMEYTGIENIYLNGTILGYTKEEIKLKIEDIINFADIGEFINQPVKTYSSGMFVRLAFAVAINVEPDILIVDEALSVGDNIFQAKCYKKFEELRGKGKTILLVTHDVDSVRRFCDRAIWIDKGVVNMEGDVDKITSEYISFTNNKPITVKKTSNHNAETSKQEVIYMEKEFKCISRWGSNIGLIKYVGLFNQKKEEIENLDKKDKFNLLIELEIDEGNSDNNFLGVAFSIKNTKGQDLIVGDTFAQKHYLLKNGRYQIIFNMENYLVPGEYYISVSLETRETKIPNYIDYIEGAHYFSVRSAKIFYGMLDVPINISTSNIV